MAMGFGCNAVGVVGCRIIDSPRERLIAILTNALVPCNGRFPTLITLITLAVMWAGRSGGAARGSVTGGSLAGNSAASGSLMGNSAAGGSLAGGPALVGSGGLPGTGELLSSLAAAAALTVLILLGILATLLSSKLLSKTVLKGLPSSFTLELPPYRRPQLWKVILRSIPDRTLFVLGRAVSVAAPAGLLIWILGNISPGGRSLLACLSALLNPLGRLLGMDGMILTGFLLGFPANEIVLPIILMGYLQTGTLTELSSPSVLMELFAAHGWTLKTIVCTALFCLFHWPCSTTCLTIKKETGSLRWTLAAFLLPTLIGGGLCFLINLLF